MEHFLCRRCLKDFALEDRKTVPEEIWAGDEHFPYTGPVCGKCLDEFLEKRRQEPS